MDSPVTLKKEWVLTRAAFDCLLAHLDADRELAGQKYERLRGKLVKYFEWQRATFPDSEADKTLNRVARRLEEGEQVDNVSAYSYGVARLVFAESLREREREQVANVQAAGTEQLSASATDEDDADADADARRACFDRCLQNLPAESRALIIEYYQDEKSGKITRRKQLGAQLGMTLNALRLRAHRIRNGLETCVRTCMAQRV